MTAYPAWTPASRPGIIPLRPLTFGTVLGRSFAALRQNPRVLLGFALCVQTAAYLIVLLGVGVVALASFVRLDTLRPGTEEFDTVMAGSIALTAIAGIVLGLAAGALGVIVQGVVVSEVAHAAVAEKLTLRGLWQRVKPVAWRLIGYSLLLTLAVSVLIAIVAAAIIAVGVAALPVAVALTILVVLAAIPITLWLTTKLLLVPAAIILEQATIRGGIVRSWTLIRGRFWPALGVIVLISLVFGGLAQVVSIPFSLLSTGLTTIITPTGDPEPTAIIGIFVAVVLTQVVTLLIQSVAVVVQATATAIIYIDCRMRREGLDIDLLTYIERRDAGAVGLADPYRENVGREIAPRPPAYPAPGYPYPQPHPGQALSGISTAAGLFPASRLRVLPRGGPRAAAGRHPTGRPPAVSGIPAHYPGSPAALPAFSRCRGRTRARACAGPGSAPRADPLDRARYADRIDRPRVTVVVAGALPRLAATTPPLTPDGDEARRWAEEELSDPVYAAAEPTPLDRIARAIGDFVERLFSVQLSGEWGPWVAVLAAVLFAVVILAAFLIWGVPRATSRSRDAAELFGVDEQRTAAELRRTAASSAARGEWDAAIVLRFRALARGVVERGAADTPPGATVHAFARAAARAFPASAAELESAAAAFDDVRYLRRPGTEELYRRIAAVDDTVTASRPVLTELAGARP